MSMNDSWFRDIGPSFVVDEESGKLAGVDWQFNAWGGLDGGCYNDWALDSLVARKICQIERVESLPADFILEGGSFDVDGEGTVLVTEQCLLNKNRNPHLSREQIEERLCAFLGVSVVIWLGSGLFGDTDTDGHVDNLAKFSSPGVVLLTWTDDSEDPQHVISADALSRLERARDARGRSIQVVKLPQPGPLYRERDEVPEVVMPDGSAPRDMGERLPASYANYYIANGGVVMPAFGVPDDDAAARAVVAAAHPDREIVQVQAREILLGGGCIHCITQQQPSL